MVPKLLWRVRHGIKLMQQGLDAHFVIAHVQKEASLLELATTDSDLIANASIEAGMDLIAPAQELLKAAGAPYEVEISLGEPGNTLIDIAQSTECDQIIIGATGRAVWAAFSSARYPGRWPDTAACR